jgi:DNA-binding CsgD family transcriptional regulator
MAAYASGARMGSRAAWTMAAGMALAIVAVGSLELVAPRDLTLGALVLVICVVAALLLDERRAVVIVAVAVGSRAVTAALGDISIGQALLEIGSFVLAAGAAIAARRAWYAAGAAPPQPVTLTPKPAAVLPSLQRLDEAALTARERQVLQMAMQGLTAVQVAERLHISKRTVETHLERAYSKLGVRSKRELIASAFDEARSALQ